MQRRLRVPIHDDANKVEHAYHVARPGAPIDLLRHRLTIGAAPVVVYEASSFFAAFVPRASLLPTDAAEKADAAAKLLLSIDAAPPFQPIAADPDHRSYSTDPPRGALRIGEWKRRIDAVVVGSDLAIVVYKATLDDMMTLASDPTKWFEDLRNLK